VPGVEVVTPRLSEMFNDVWSGRGVDGELMMWVIV
jgi:hypothetical protein